MNILGIDIGSKLICRNDAIEEELVDTTKTIFPNWIQKGQEYTVREVLITPFVISVLFEELTNSVVFMNNVIGEREAGFNLWRFVPSMEQGKAGNDRENNL